MSIFSMILGIVLYFIALDIDKSQDNVVPAVFAWFGGYLFALGIYQTFFV